MHESKSELFVIPNLLRYAQVVTGLMDQTGFPKAHFSQASQAVPVMLSKRVPLADLQNDWLAAQIHI